MITYLTITKVRERNVHLRCCRRHAYYVYDMNRVFSSHVAPAGMLILTATHSDIYERGGHGLLVTTVCTVNR